MIMRYIDNIPMPMMVIITIWMLVAPIVPEPHLVEKLRMLYNGTLVKGIDIFDLFLHSTPLVILIIKVVRKYKLL